MNYEILESLEFGLNGSFAVCKKVETDESLMRFNRDTSLRTTL